MTDWQAALREAQGILEGRVVRPQDTWCREPEGTGPAAVGLYVGDGTLRAVAVRDNGCTGWRFVGGSLAPLSVWSHVIARYLACYQHEAPLTLCELVEVPG